MPILSHEQLRDAANDLALLVQHYRWSRREIAGLKVLLDALEYLVHELRQQVERIDTGDDDE